jgi:pentapeptide MXKDX repeat protein
VKKTILVATCVAAFSAFTALGASAQTTGPAAQQTMKTTDPMNANARMHHHKHHKAMKKDEMKQDDMPKGDMSKDGMKDGMKKDGMSK